MLYTWQQRLLVSQATHQSCLLTKKGFLLMSFLACLGRCQNESSVKFFELVCKAKSNKRDAHLKILLRALYPSTYVCQKDLEMVTYLISALIQGKTKIWAHVNPNWGTHLKITQSVKLISYMSSLNLSSLRNSSVLSEMGLVIVVLLCNLRSPLNLIV